MADLTDEERARIAAHRDELVNQEIVRRLSELARNAKTEERTRIGAVIWVICALAALLVVVIVAKWVVSADVVRPGNVTPPSTSSAQRFTDPNKYSIAIRSRIALKFVAPPGVPDHAQTAVSLSLSESGAITSLVIDKTSGVPIYDEAVRQAILLAAPLPVLIDSSGPALSLKIVW